jgi:hypothetical protein
MGVSTVLVMFAMFVAWRASREGAVRNPAAIAPALGAGV